MSLLPPRSNQEAKFQYCNYGRNRDKYPTFEDCMKNYMPNVAKTEFPQNITTSTTSTTTTIAPTTTNNTTKYLLYVALGIIAFMIFKKKK
jgi:hypothetical protein